MRLRSPGVRRLQPSHSQGHFPHLLIVAMTRKWGQTAKHSVWHTATHKPQLRHSFWPAAGQSLLRPVCLPRVYAGAPRANLRASSSSAHRPSCSRRPGLLLPSTVSSGVCAAGTGTRTRTGAGASSQKGLNSGRPQRSQTGSPVPIMPVNNFPCMCVYFNFSQCLQIESFPILIGPDF